MCIYKRQTRVQTLALQEYTIILRNYLLGDMTDVDVETCWTIQNNEFNVPAS
jgi:hypothetical protein